MNFIVLLTMSTLTIAGVFHIYWVLGGTVGLDKVIPTKNAKALLSPGKSLTAAVGFLVLCFALLAYLLNFQSSNTMPYFTEVMYAGWFLSLIFFLRFIGDFNAVGLFKKIKSTTFAHYDTKYFSFGLSHFHLSHIMQGKELSYFEEKRYTFK